MSRSTSHPLVPLTVLGTCVFLIVLSWPSEWYRGDNFVPRAECIHFVQTGQFGIPYSRASEIEEFVDVRGQYFFENDSEQRYYSKYGLTYSLIALPPVLIEQVLFGDLELIDHSVSLFMILNLYSLFFVAVAVGYVWKLAGLYASGRRDIIAFVFASVFGTFFWFYLRVHAHDTYQIAATLAFVFHLIAFRRASRSALTSSDRRRSLRHLLVATLFLGILTHMRFSYALLYLPLFVWGRLPGRPELASVPNGSSDSADPLRQLFFAMICPAFLMIGLLLFAQWWKFGSPWNHGYAQWSRVAPNPVLSYPLARVPRALGTYFVYPGNGNVFLHYPPVIFALFGWYGFLRKWKAEAWCLLCVAALLLLPVANWRSEGTGYGPRYLLAASIIMSLPLFEVMQRLRESATPVPRVLFGCLFWFAIGWSGLMQVRMNSLPPFSFFDMRASFQSLASSGQTEDEMTTYFSPAHRGMIARDYLAFRFMNKEFPPVEIFAASIPEAKRQSAREHLRQRIHANIEINYLLIRIVSHLNAKRTEQLSKK